MRATFDLIEAAAERGNAEAARALEWISGTIGGAFDAGRLHDMPQLDGSDSCERVAEALAVWLKESAPERFATMTRLPWLAGWNRPGYMPDGEPAEFESFGDALQYLHGELKLEAERAAERGDEQGEEDADKLETLAARLVETVPANRDFAANAAGYEWWIKESAE
jgi:hypothetical protein